MKASYNEKPCHNGRGYILSYRNAPVVGGLAGGYVHLQSCQTFLTTPASTALAEASRGVKIVALMALANLRGFALSSFHTPTLSIAADFQIVAGSKVPVFGPGTHIPRILVYFRFAATD